MSDQYLKRRAFFDEHAHVWDEICTHDEKKLNIILDAAGLKEGDSVLDVGTGTGILIPHIVKRVSSKGNIIAIDYSHNMILKAREKYPSEEFINVSFRVKDYLAMEMDHTFNAIICYSCFPHIDDKQLFFQKSYTLLNKGGTLLIAHSESRSDINQIHSRKHSAVRSDHLPSKDEITELASSCGFLPCSIHDNEQMFYILFEK